MLFKISFVRRYFLILIALVSSHLYGQSKLTEKDLKELYHTMKGEYSSLEQSLSDTDFYHIKLVMVPMWEQREGYWLYVEQAMDTKEDKPYRQRVYELTLNDDNTKFISKVYTINNGEAYFGAYKDLMPLEELTIDSLELRSGCSIILSKSSSNTYKGSTNNKDCESNLRGASYATSKVEIFSDKLISWDRGYDKEDKQVWGAIKGGYIFVKEIE